jgi:hypothetical protein
MKNELRGMWLDIRKKILYNIHIKI